MFNFNIDNSKQPIKVIHYNTVITEHQNEIAFAFNEYFANVIKELNIPDCKIGLNYVNTFRRNIHTNFDLSPTNGEKIIESLN